MQVHHNLDHVPTFSRAVVTIGTFDGVHRGHRVILQQLISTARETDGETVVITFHPHPRRVLQNREAPRLLNTLDEKIGLLEAAGIDHLVVVPFTPGFAALSAREYIEDFLLKRISPATLIIGYDHRFGHDRLGNFQLLAEYAAKGAFQLVQIPEQVIEQAIISSTAIRQALSGGDIERAGTLLGYAYFFSGIVVRGDQRGRTIGFPTANIALHDADKLVPGNGVYLVRAEWDGETHAGMMNIGIRPTVGGTTLTVEVHVLQFDGDLYGKDFTVTVLQRLRSEQKFDSFQHLKTQLQTDKTAALQYFNLQ